MNIFRSYREFQNLNILDVNLHLGQKFEELLGGRRDWTERIIDNVKMIIKLN